MLIKNYEELEIMKNGEVLVDRDGVVFQAGERGEFFTPGCSNIAVFTEIQLPAFRVFPLELSPEELIRMNETYREMLVSGEGHPMRAAIEELFRSEDIDED